jgi:serine O-acetyltransferase
MNILSSIKKICKKIYHYLNRTNTSLYYWQMREKVISNSKGFMRYYYLYRMEKMHERFNCSIPLNANIANTPSFPHGLNGIFISMGARIGRNCVIFHQVTIGSNTLADSNIGAPIIGDEVYIGAGAKIIGNIRVGNNVRIGANCVVIKDVPDNCTIVAAHARLIGHNMRRNNTFTPYNNIRSESNCSE